jgi:hypothetical protein
MCSRICASDLGPAIRGKVRVHQVDYLSSIQNV